MNGVNVLDCGCPWMDRIQCEHRPDKPNRSAPYIASLPLGQLVCLRRSRPTVGHRTITVYQINVEYGSGTRCVWLGEDEAAAQKVYRFEVQCMDFDITTGGWANVSEPVRKLVLA